MRRVLQESLAALTDEVCDQLVVIASEERWHPDSERCRWTVHPCSGAQANHVHPPLHPVGRRSEAAGPSYVVLYLQHLLFYVDKLSAEPLGGGQRNEQVLTEVLVDGPAKTIARLVLEAKAYEAADHLGKSAAGQLAQGRIAVCRLTPDDACEDGAAWQPNCSTSTWTRSSCAPASLPRTRPMPKRLDTPTGALTPRQAAARAPHRPSAAVIWPRPPRTSWKRRTASHLASSVRVACALYSAVTRSNALTQSWAGWRAGTLARSPVLNRRTVMTRPCADAAATTALLLNTLLQLVTEAAVDANACLVATSLQQRRQLLTGLLTLASGPATPAAAAAQAAQLVAAPAAWALAMLEEPALVAALRRSTVRRWACVACCSVYRGTRSSLAPPRYACESDGCRRFWMP